jgi:hypothetical protein
MNVKGEPNLRQMKGVGEPPAFDVLAWAQLGYVSNCLIRWHLAVKINALCLVKDNMLLLYGLYCRLRCGPGSGCRQKPEWASCLAAPA